MAQSLFKFKDGLESVAYQEHISKHMLVLFNIFA